MSGRDTISFRAKQFFERLPGKRGVDIPEDVYDRIYPVARGITEQIWGRPPTPRQLQELYDNDLTHPDQIRQAYGALPHPFAKGLTVAEYQRYLEAYQVYREHR